MAYDFDEANPTDDSIVSQFPANERSSRSAILGAYEEEHDEATGRHKFLRGVTASRPVDPVEGTLYINTDRITGEEVLDWYNGSTWVETAFAITDIGQDWSGLQVGAAYYDLNAAAGGGDYDTGATPGEVNLDWDDGNFQKVTLSKDTKLMNGLNKPSVNKAVDMRLVVTQDGGGTHTLDLGAESDYVFAFGIEPVISTGASEVNVLTLSLLPSGKVLVSLSGDVS